MNPRDTRMPIVYFALIFILIAICSMWLFMELLAWYYPSMR